MPLDSKRIEGFGGRLEVLYCPEGHTLQPWTARAGVCDGPCGRRVAEGEQVLDCRRCNFYLCDSCQKTYTSPDNSFWGTFSSMMDMVKQDFVEMASDLRSFAGLDEEEEAAQAAAAQPSLPSAAGRDWRPLLQGSPHEREEACGLIAEFCEQYPDTRVEPDEDALHNLWARMSVLYGCVLHPGPLAFAICQQLRLQSDKHWQPRLRALCVLQLCAEQGAVGKEIFQAVTTYGVELVQGLRVVPECRDKAACVLKLMGHGPAEEVSADSQAAQEPAAAPGAARGAIAPAAPAAPAPAPAAPAAKALDLLGDMDDMST